MQCCEPIVTWLCLNIVNRLFALCFFMVIDLRLKDLRLSGDSRFFFALK